MIFYQTAKLKDVEDCPYFVSCSVSIPVLITLLNFNSTMVRLKPGGQRPHGIAFGLSIPLWYD